MTLNGSEVFAGAMQQNNLESFNTHNRISDMIQEWQTLGMNTKKGLQHTTTDLQDKNQV